jgi:transcriptional regulator with XRE-family HTH domain
VDLGSRVRDRRKALDLSQEALARRADVSLNLINRVERGETRDPHYSTLVSIAGALGVSVGELLEETPVPLGEENSRLQQPIDVEGKTPEELFELKERLAEERSRLNQRYFTEQLKNPTVSEWRKQDARFIALLNELNVRDALDEIAGEQHATTSREEDTD